MKYLILAATFVLSLSAYSQYSTYYGTVNSNNKQVNANINLTSKSTITSIDYGSLALANAEREKTRLQSLQYANELEKQRALEIAINPMKAFDYGNDNLYVLKKDQAKIRGFNKLSWFHKIPHNTLFIPFVAGMGWSYRNVSENNVKTELFMEGILYINGLEKGLEKDGINGLILSSPEEYSKFDNVKVGQMNGNDFIHKKELKKAKVFGVDGFKSTLIYENEYELVIADYFIASIDGSILSANVQYKGDKGEVTFEELEGRRYYLKRLCEQLIATSFFPVQSKRE
jgi:hypothetical protein